jgi:thiol-disulfide isomerase/thioredoxin
MRKVEALKFWAPWCRPCVALSTVLEGVEMRHYNIDEESSKDAVAKYRIRNIPQIVFVEVGDNGEDSQELHRHVGIISKQTYLDTLERLGQSGEISSAESLALEIKDKLIEK